MLRKTAVLLALVATIPIPVLAAGPPGVVGPPGLFSGLYSELVVFGDSLSDDGNLFELTGGELLPYPYAGGRASNGPVWVEYLAADLEIPMTNSAVVAARTGKGFTDPPQSLLDLGADPSTLQIPTVGQQIDDYLAVDGLAADALVVVWAGPNDIFSGLSAGQIVDLLTAQAVIEQSVTNIGDHIAELAANGAEQFLIPNMPPLEKTPFGLSPEAAPIHPLLEYMSLLFNTLLAAELDALEAELGVSIIQFDVHTLLNDVIASPYPYGFLDAENAYLFLALDPPGPGPLLSPDFFLFWDDVHPTTAGHQVLAQEALYPVIENALVP